MIETLKNTKQESQPWHKPEVRKLVISLDTTSNNSVPVAGLAQDFAADD